MQKHAPNVHGKPRIGAKDAEKPRVCPLTLAIFNQRHPRELFNYKDLQSADLFGPAMAFRITRTPGWLAPDLIQGRPKYLPEAVLAALNRLRAGEMPDEFKDCLGRGQRPPPQRRSSSEPQPALAEPIPNPFKTMLVPLKAHEIHHRGKRRWRIIVGRDWAPVLKCKPGKRRLFSSKEQVQGFITTAQKRLEEFAKGNGSFTDAEFATFRLVLGMVNGDCQKLLTAVQQFVKEEEASPAKKPRKAKVVARHYLMTRNLNGAFRDKTLPTVRYEAGVFTKKFGNILITQIPRNDLQLWIRKLKLEPKTKKNIKGTVKLIFDYAIKLGLIKDNPTTEVELPKIDQAEPERFAASQCELLLKTGVRTKSPALPAVVIELFTGARPAEVARTGWQKVSLKEKRINIPGRAGKTHQYRWVSIPPILRQWLIFFGIKEKGPIIRGYSTDTYEQWRQELAEEAGLDEVWPHDALRHTNASFDYALQGDFKVVAKNLGNTVQVSRTNYIAPASLTEAKHLLKLTPKYILRLIAEEDRASAKRNGEAVRPRGTI